MYIKYLNKRFDILHKTCYNVCMLNKKLRFKFECEDINLLHSCLCDKDADKSYFGWLYVEQIMEKNKKRRKTP